jgi:hypothetical protein
MQALSIHAGPRALKHLRERGLSPDDVRVMPGAAGGPKALVLNAIDRLLLTQWLPRARNPVHLIGASVGAWRMAVACLSDADAMFARWAHEYIHMRYPRERGKTPSAATVTRVFGETLEAHFGGRESQVLAHPTFRVHVIASRGRKLLRREGRGVSRARTALGYLGAYVTNAASRRAMGAWLERVLFSDARDPLPLSLDDYRTARALLTADNLRPSILASCSIPFVLEAVHDIPGAPRGAYWDGGLTDYHLHLNYASMGEGLVLYPHFQSRVVPGWLDKALRHRHRATPWLDNLVVLSPSPEWVASLPNAKLPDRRDFKTYGDDDERRAKVWSRGHAESARLADELDAQLRRSSIQAQPLV